MRKYFEAVETIEELKKAYVAQCKRLHPDMNLEEDTTEAFKEMQNEYDAVFQQLKNKAFKETFNDFSEELDEMFQTVINAIIKYNVNIELIGRWIWVSGNTYACKEILKELGFKWCSGKKMWQWHKEEDGSTSFRKMSMDEIKNLHGCTEIKKAKEDKKIAMK